MAGALALHLHLGASKNQLLRYLGTLDGAVGGGFKGLQSAMDGSWEAGSGGGGGETVASAALPEVPVELSSDHMELDGASDPADSSAECALTKPSAEVRGRSKAAAQSAVAALTNMSLSWEDDSPNWKFLLVAARHAKDKVERALAGTDSFEDVSGSELIPNADAWEGPRRKDFVEIATDKRKHQQRLAANAAARATARAAAKNSSGSDSDEVSGSSMSAVPKFLPVKAAPKKLKSCRAEIKAMAKSRLQHCSIAEPAQGLGSDQVHQTLAATGSTAAAETQPRGPPGSGQSLSDLLSGSYDGQAAIVPRNPSPRAETPPKRLRRSKADKPLRYKGGVE